MTFGQKMTMVRKQKKMSQQEVGKISGVNGDIVGKYERDEMKPSIETAKKLADALEISLDYLVGEGEKILDKKTLKRLQDLEHLEDDKKKTLYDLIDTYIRDAKIRKAHSG